MSFCSKVLSLCTAFAVCSSVSVDFSSHGCPECLFNGMKHYFKEVKNYFIAHKIVGNCIILSLVGLSFSTNDPMCFLTYSFLTVIATILAIPITVCAIEILVMSAMLISDVCNTVFTNILCYPFLNKSAKDNTKNESISKLFTSTNNHKKNPNTDNTISN